MHSIYKSLDEAHPGTRDCRGSKRAKVLSLNASDLHMKEVISNHVVFCSKSEDENNIRMLWSSSRIPRRAMALQEPSKKTWEELRPVLIAVRILKGRNIYSLEHLLTTFFIAISGTRPTPHHL